MLINPEAACIEAVIGVGACRISWGIPVARDRLAATLNCWLTELPIQKQHWISNFPTLIYTLPLFARLIRVELGTVHFPPIRWDGDRADWGIPHHHRSIENGDNYCTSNLQMGIAKPPATTSHLIKGH